MSNQLAGRVEKLEAATGIKREGDTEASHPFLESIDCDVLKRLIEIAGRPPLETSEAEEIFLSEQAAKYEEFMQGRDDPTEKPRIIRMLDNVLLAEEYVKQIEQMPKQEPVASELETHQRPVNELSTREMDKCLPDEENTRIRREVLPNGDVILHFNLYGLEPDISQMTCIDEYPEGDFSRPPTVQYVRKMMGL